MNPFAEWLRLCADVIDPRGDAYAKGYADGYIDGYDAEAQKRRRGIDNIAEVIYGGGSAPKTCSSDGEHRRMAEVAGSSPALSKARPRPGVAPTFNAAGRAPLHGATSEFLSSSSDSATAATNVVQLPIPL